MLAMASCGKAGTKSMGAHLAEPAHTLKLPLRDCSVKWRQAAVVVSLQQLVDGWQGARYASHNLVLLHLFVRG